MPASETLAAVAHGAAAAAVLDERGIEGPVHGDRPPLQQPRVPALYVRIRGVFPRVTGRRRPVRNAPCPVPDGSRLRSESEDRLRFEGRRRLPDERRRQARPVGLLDLLRERFEGGAPLAPPERVVDLQDLGVGQAGQLGRTLQVAAQRREAGVFGDAGLLAQGLLVDAQVAGPEPTRLEASSEKPSIGRPLGSVRRARSWR